MLYSHASELAIRAALFLALQPPGKLSPVREIAKGTGLSEPYLAKIMRRLTRSDLVRAFRGPSGGVELARAPHAISLSAIIRAIDGSVEPQWCALGLHICSAERPCPLHHQWVPLRAAIQRMLEETTLAMLAPGLREALLPEQQPWTRGAAERNRGRDGTGKKRKAS